MLNRSEILRKAWTNYRAQDRLTPGFKFSSKLFSRHLRRALDYARYRELYAQRCAAEAALPASVQAIRAELVAMEMSDAPIDWERHRELNVELFRASIAMGEARA
jgi:hypothetical protein